ncbi:nucleotide sugar dehydrogenase [Gammaproteobacteria bacterium]|nr:nucleotide sugar dehydrogenase [Gammaproteobacteria bacterium]
MKLKKITVVGSGYVGMSLAVLLSQHHQVCIYDIDQERVKKINNGISTISDKDIDHFLKSNNLKLSATLDAKIAFEGADFVIIATPTNYNEETKEFDTSSIESSVKKVLGNKNKKPLIIIKSTVPIGYTLKLRDLFNYKNIVFSPEFLREGSALNDNLFPSRIIFGDKSQEILEFSEILKKSSKQENTKLLFMESTEAECVKLFSNTYLAMRVAFFNELDSFSMKHELNSEDIIKGVSSDSRIGDQYNNPSFGYGGYCFPKDTKQLLANFKDVPQNLIKSIVDSNETRKYFIAEEIAKKDIKTVGIFRLIMKDGSDNFRFAAVMDIIDMLNEKGLEILIYEPLHKSQTFHSYKVIHDLNDFKELSNIIIANRFSEKLNDVSSKIFTRDIFGNN